MATRKREPEPDERRIVLERIPWATYVHLRDSLPGAGVRMTYLKGRLEIMSPSKLHEVGKTQVARFLELFCLESDIPLFGYGSMTIRDEGAERGLEPDECYARGTDRDRPQLAIEVVVTTDLIDKLEVYRGLGIGELWRFEAGAFTVLELTSSGYTPIPQSRVFPEVDLEEIARHVAMPDQHAALKAYRTAIRSRLGT